MNLIDNWQANVQARWQALQAREQRMLLVLTVATLIFLLFMLLVLPLQNWRSAETERLANSNAELKRVRELVAIIKAQENQPANENLESLAIIIDKSLKQNNLVMRGFQPGSNGDVRLRLDNAAYSDLMQWLYELEYKHNLLIQELALTPASAYGRLMVNMRISR